MEIRMDNFALNHPKENNNNSYEMEKKLKMEEFYNKYFEADKEKIKRISLEQLKELKEKGITTEMFLNFVCQKNEFMLHGSVREISDEKLKSNSNKIFATDMSAIAIMKSLYSNVGVDLDYSYYINKENPLVLKIHTSPDGKFTKTENGFIYLVKNAGFKNDPEGSWQFIREGEEVEFVVMVETEYEDFQYTVEVYKDLDSSEE